MGKRSRFLVRQELRIEKRRRGQRDLVYSYLIYFALLACAGVLYHYLTEYLSISLGAAKSAPIETKDRHESLGPRPDYPAAALVALLTVLPSLGKELAGLFCLLAFFLFIIYLTTVLERFDDGPPTPTIKECNVCREKKDKAAFSNKQWNARQVRKCIACATPAAAGPTLSQIELAARLRAIESRKRAIEARKRSEEADNNFRLAVDNFEEMVQNRRLELGGAHPEVLALEQRLRGYKAALHAGEASTPSTLNEVGNNKHET